MKKHRVAVVGCGALASCTHLPNSRKNPRIELICACDADASSAAKAKESFGAGRAETDWRKVVEAEDVDVCVLATRQDFRGEFIIPALEAGKPVYTEKPLAPDRKEMFDILRASRRTGVPVCVGHNRRSSPAMLEFHRLVEKARRAPSPIRPSVDRGEVHKPLPEEDSLQLLMRVNDDSRSWKGYAFEDDSDGTMFAEMVHFIDLALWLNPSPPTRVMAEGSIRGNFCMILTHADGSLCTTQHSLNGSFDYPKELFEASTSFVTVAMDQHLELRQAGLPDESMVQTFPHKLNGEEAPERGMSGYMAIMERELKRATETGGTPGYQTPNKGHYEHLDRFLTHVEGEGENPCDLASAVVVNRLALKFMESARLGLPVAVAPEDWHIPE